jgi:hypothetical protein
MIDRRQVPSQYRFYGLWCGRQRRLLMSLVRDYLTGLRAAERHYVISFWRSCKNVQVQTHGRVAIRKLATTMRCDPLNEDAGPRPNHFTIKPAEPGSSKGTGLLSAER